MNREIKFRMWDGKKMYLPQDCDDTDFYVTCEGDVRQTVNKDYYEYTVYRRGCQLMQFTGLRDKNDIEIYEGDIVRFSAHYFGDSYIKESIQVIEYNVCQWNDNLWIGYADRPEWCEVIGNIFENADLLESK